MSVNNKWRICSRFMDEAIQILEKDSQSDQWSQVTRGF
jgi:hypothetical protein